MALADEDITSAFREGWNTLRPQIGPFLIYFLLRGGVSIAIVLLGAIALVLCVGLVGVVFFGIGFAAHAVLWSGGGAGKALSILLWTLLGGSLFIAYMAGLFSIAGFRNLFRAAYAMLFYGGYYPPLGNLLLAPQQTPVTPATSPAFEPPADLPPPQAIW